MWWIRFAFASHFFRRIAEYTDLSGLSGVVNVGNRQILRVAFDFGTSTSSHSFLFSDSIPGLLPSQPRFTGGISQFGDSEIFVQNNFGWLSRLVHENLEIGGYSIPEFPFGLVQSRAETPYREFQEVAGIISFNRDSILAQGRILSLGITAGPFVSLKSFGPRRLPWPPGTVSVVAIPGSPKWLFSAHRVSIGDQEFAAPHTLFVDPGSSDVVFPQRYRDLTREALGVFKVLGNSARVFVPFNQWLEFLDVVIRINSDSNGAKLRLDPKSLRFSPDVENRNAKIVDGIVFVPLRIRFFVSNSQERQNYITVGRAFLRSYKGVLLDNIDSKIRFVPRLFGSSVENPSIMIHPRQLGVKLALIEREVSLIARFNGFPFAFMAQRAPLHNIDDYLLPFSWTVEEDAEISNLRVFKLVLVRSFPDYSIPPESITQSRSLPHHAAIRCVLSVFGGLTLFADAATSDPAKSLTVSIQRAQTHITFKFIEGIAPSPSPGLLNGNPTPAPVMGPPSAALLTLPSPVRIETDRPEECYICLEAMKSGEPLQLPSSCGHAFHDECIRPWVMEKGQNTCPNCRKPITF